MTVYYIVHLSLFLVWCRNMICTVNAPGQRWFLAKKQIPSESGAVDLTYAVNQ